ncbi:Asparagine synthase [Haladaptatus litoreus]|uniref:Asparagine synthase n=1 Tax=Haladaptatus litoreus TaxID=553468 RepID=A0A1N7DMW6_9EURY|nr:asparagine synthase-related protein [Haladaptatus litoreus]SIR77199.1 Asparagine synthase [Haladaptatus litoreus]
MNKEIFGVFGDRNEFEQFRSVREFDDIVTSDVATVGIRDTGLGIPGRSASYSGENGSCIIWGEAYPNKRGWSEPARWLLEQYIEKGKDAIKALNGSYLAFIVHEGDTVVLTDPIRSWECFYTDDPGVRVFGSDAAEVAKTIDDPTMRKQSVGEFLHMGVILGNKTLFHELHRTSFDGYLTPDEAGDLDRFIYNEQDMDYPSELADRMQRAIRRRSRQPGKKGLLLSAGYDSRTLLSQFPEIEHCYTVGKPEAQEVKVARRLAKQYGVDHTTLVTNDRYIMPGEQKVRDTNGIKESIHIHHAGYNNDIEVDTMYHGLLFDTLLRGFGHKRSELKMFGKTLPLKRMEIDPDPTEASLDNFGYMPDKSRVVAEQYTDDLDAAGNFVRDAIASEFDRCWSRTDSVQNALSLFSISNQPTIPFRTHLADNYLESFIAADTELLDWHLQTPPKYRNTATFIRAIRQLDEDLFRHRPPDRPYMSTVLSEVERFARRKLPFIKGFEPAWPDRQQVYDRYNLDQRLFPQHESIHNLPPRHKLRINDMVGWVAQCSKTVVNPTDVLYLQMDASGADEISFES